MATSPFRGVHAAIRARLIADATLMALVTGVFDEVPPDQPYDYIVLDDPTLIEGEMPTMGREGWEMTLTAHVWSDDKGYAKVYDVLARMNALLHRQQAAIAVTGYLMPSLENEFAEALRDPDAAQPDQNLRHLVARYRARVQVAA